MIVFVMLALLADEELAARLRELDPKVGVPERSLPKEARALLQAANLRESEAWRSIASKEDWERYRDARLRGLRASLGREIPVPKDLKVRITRTLEGEGYRIENVVFESRPGLIVTANLYGPSKPSSSAPGILICHSHHNAKTQGELQAMGITWARQGCRVLVMDQLGHGERRTHPFVAAGDYAGAFRVGRQDYYFRYVTGLQLQVAGESLAGWMAWDLQRGVDLLLSLPGTDRDRIILLGAVAGGGDPCAVAATLDPRIAAAVPFNFGGPQPESPYPLPEDAEASFNYAGGGSWESTRNLRLSARDGFLPWVIVGAVAPRGLIYAHEFSWDRERDPVWKRLERIWDLEGARDRLAFATGRGRLSGKPPEATHCNNIGPEHLKGIYPSFHAWFGLPVPEREAAERHSAADLACLTPDLKPRALHAVVSDLPREKADWARLLGPIEPGEARTTAAEPSRVGDIDVERLRIGDVPVLLLLPPGKRRPVVVAVAQEGKAGFLRHRSGPIAELLRAGTAVALPDVRGTGENGPLGSGRGRTSGATAQSATEWMLGRTLVGLRLSDLRTVLRGLRARKDLDPDRLSIWGDSFAPLNPSDKNLAAPLDADPFPVHAEPLGDLLALFAGHFEGNVRAIYTSGGLKGFASLLESPYCYVPHDAIVPGAAAAGDLEAVAAALPRVRRENLVDGLNRRVPPAEPEVGPVRWFLGN